MMKRTLSFLLCLIMVVSLAAPSVQASGSDNAYDLDELMDGIFIEDGSNVEIVMDGNTVNTNQESKLPNPAIMLTEPTTPTQIPVVTAPVVPVVPAPVVKEVCECVDLASAKAHGGICNAKLPYIELCKLTEEELFARWSSYTAVEQSFLMSHLEEQYPLKHFNLEKLLSAPTGTASETYADGTTVSVEGIPQDGSLTVDKAADAVKDIVDDYVAEQEQEATPLFGYDVSVQDGEGADWQPDTTVKMELELPGEKLHKNTKVFVVHVDDNGVATTIEAEVTEDGKIVFETPGFSAFYGFTVDFHYEDVTFSIPGMSSIKLSELFDELKVPLNASDVVALEYTDDTQLKIEQLEGDWLLTSLKAFSTEEKLTMTMADGSVYEIKVTDAEVTGGTHYWHLYNGYYSGYNHVYSATRFPLNDNYAAGTGDNAIFNAYFEYAWDTVNGEWYYWNSADDNYDQTLYFDGPGAQTSTVILQPKTNKETLVLDMFGEWVIRNGANVTIKVDPNYTGVTKNIIIRTIAPDKPIFSIVNSSLTLQGTANTKIILDFGTSGGAPANKGQGNCYPIIWENGKDDGTTTARSLNLEYVTFRNSAYSAIDLYYSQMSNVTLKNCTFESTVDNVSHGGAVRVRSEYKVALSKFEAIDCDFTGNSANNTSVSVNDKGETTYGAGRGGAIAIQRNVPTLTFTRCDFTNTNSDGHGGAICVNQDGDKGVAITTASFTGCTFTGCSSKYLNSANYLEGGRGGAVRIISSSATTLTINDCDFDDCEATSHGGAFSWQGTLGNITVNNGSTFTDCTAGNRGGAIGVACANIGNITLNGVTFSGNTAGSLGGAVHFGLDGATSPITAGAVNVDSCTFADNMAHGVGGGLCLTDGKYASISVSNSTFDNCDTTGYGGALGFKVASDGGKAVFSVTGDVKIIGCDFTNCLAGNLAPNAYLDTETQEGVVQWDHDGDSSTDPIDQLNGASGAGAIILGGTIGGVVEIKGTSATDQSLFQNCLTWNNGAGIYFTNDLDVVGKKDATTGKYTEGITLQYVKFDKCFARDAGSAVYFSSTSIPRLDMKDSLVQYCGYFDAADKNFDDPDASVVDAASLIEITGEWFTTQVIYDVTGYDEEGKPIRVKNDSKTAATKTEQLTRWLSYDKEDFYPGTDYSGTFRTVGNTACVAYITNTDFLYNRSYSNGGAVYWNANQIIYTDETQTTPKFTTALTISNCDMQHNYASGFGGAVFCEGSVTMESCIISDNTAGLRGGGIAQNVYNNTSRQLGSSSDDEGTTLILRAAEGGEPVKIYNNTSLDGGGISITVAMTNSYPHTVKPGTANKDINKPDNWIFDTDFTYDVKFQLGGTYVYNNHATRNGGGIYYDTTYYLNEPGEGPTGEDADKNGDHVSWAERQRQVDSFVKDIMIDDGLIYGNTSGYGATKDNGQGGNGGGVYMNSNQINTPDTILEGEKTGSSTVTITGGSVYDNHAVMGNGGGIFLRGKNAVCTITGGVIGATANKVTANGVVTMTPNVSKPNTATGYVKSDATTVGGNGGGIAVFGGVRLEMDGGYIVNNSSDIAGGGIAVHEESSMKFTDGTVKNNSANMGGGISLNGAKPLDASSTDDAEKYAMFLDGGIIQGNKVIPITYTSNVYGGGVCLSNKSTMKISDGEINENIASKNLNGDTFGANQEGGGIAVCQESVLEISGGVIKKNKAYEGGGIVVRGGSSTTMTGELSINSTTDAVNVSNSKGIVMENEATRRGGGIMVNGGSSSFTMNNGYIYANHSYGSSGETVGGGGVCIEFGDFTLNNGRLDGNTSAWYGGGIFGYMADIIINNCVMKSNTAGRHGGAVGNRYGDTTIQTGRFENNSASNRGGAIYHLGAANYMTDFKISGGDFKNNTASVDGGALAAITCQSVTIEGGNFTNNTATTGSGGGAYLQQVNDVDITTGCTFRNNHADSGNGGALYVNNVADTAISGGSFTENTGKNGGALCAYSGTKLVISGGTFESNTASVSGGGLNINAVSDFQLSNGTFKTNYATNGNGAGMFMLSVPGAEISGGTFTENAGMFGGGLFMDRCTDVTFTGGEFIKNKSNQGAGLFIRTSSVSISTVTIDQNTVTDHEKYNVADDKMGGGLYIDSGYGPSVVTIGGGTFSNNSAPYGGGIWMQNRDKDVDETITLTINGGTIENNHATIDGGGIFVHGGGVGTDEKHTSLTMNGGSVCNNIADGNGGGIYTANRARVTVQTGTVSGKETHGDISENTANNGGGVYVIGGARLAVIGGYITYNNATAPSGSSGLFSGYWEDTALYGTGGGICVTKGRSDAPSTFTLSAPAGSNNMAIYGNMATFSADDVFSSGEFTQLTVPTVQSMNMEEYGFAPEGWFEDYNTNDMWYNNGINMLNAAYGEHKALRYRNAVGHQRIHITPLYVLGEIKDGNTVVESVPDEKSYVNKADAYVAMTLGIPAAVDDTVVIDYTGPVNINLYENDLFLKKEEFTKEYSHLYYELPKPSSDGDEMPNPDDAEDNGVIYKNYVYLSRGELPVGAYWTNLSDARADVWNGNTVNNGGIVTYNPKFSKFNKDESLTQDTLLDCSTEDTFGYTVYHNKFWYYAKVTVVPATTLYFEDNASYITYHTTSTKEKLAEWKPVNSVGQTSAVTELNAPLQNQDRPGFTGLESLDAENIYGYDSAYATTATFSNGSAHWVRAARYKHEDTNGDKKCEFCGQSTKHSLVDANNDNICDTCLIPGCHGSCQDEDGNNRCDKCNNVIEHTCVDNRAPQFLCDICGRAAGTHTTSGRATFTFTGTGFDVVGLCNKDTGIVMVSVYKGVVEDFDKPPLTEERYVASYIVDTHYGYRYDEENGKWIVDENSTDSLYQVPVIKADLTKVMTKMDDPNTEEDETEYKDWGYGTYSVEIYVANSFLEREPGYWNADFYLDSIRIYNPAGVGENVNGTALEAYQKDNEAWPAYVEVRNLLIDQAVLDDEANDGVIFIDGKDKDVTLENYTSWGPNNEVYLNPGEHIAFTMNMANYGQDVKSIHMAMRGLTGQSNVLVQAGTGAKDKVGVLNKALSTTDMYYDISQDANGASVAGKVITISNAGTNPIAISTVKVTHGTKPEKDKTIGGLIQSSMMTGYIALEMLSTDPAGNPVVTPKYPALSYNGMICYNVFFSAEDLGSLTADDLGLAVFDSYDPEGTVETAKDVIMGATEVDGLFMVATNGVNAKYLGDTQYFRTFAKQADGSYVYSKMVSYSALDYAKNVLSKSNDVKLKQLVVAMLNYGAEAQKYFGYQTDNLMNKDLTADDQALLTGLDASSLNSVGTVDPTKVGVFASTGGFTRRSPAISFNGAFEINYFFTPANAPDGGMTLYFWDEDTYNSVTELTAENADKVADLKLENGTYTAASDEIIARELDKTLYVAAVYESKGVTYCSGVLPYSIAAYCQKPPADVQALATAAGIYGCTAKQYFGE